MDCSTPGFPVDNQLLEFTQTCTSTWWCHPTISSPVISFFSYLRSFPTSGSFSVSQFFTSVSQSIGISASTSVLLMNIQDWFPLGLMGWISLQTKGLSRVFFNTTVKKHQFFCVQPSLWSNSHKCMFLYHHISQSLTLESAFYFRRQRHWGFTWLQVEAEEGKVCFWCCYKEAR